MSKSARNRAQRSNALTERTVPWGGIAFFSVIGVVTVIAITFAFLQSRPSDDDGDAASIAGLVSKDKDKLGRNHVSGSVTYDTTPPMGGDHDAVWQNCDGQVYDKQLRNENAVHSLEHGAVWITYRPGLDAGQLGKLTDKVKSTDYTMISPYPGLDAPIAVTAWGKQIKVQDAGDKRIDTFLRAFVKGPQTPEPGANCDGAKATP